MKRTDKNSQIVFLHGNFINVNYQEEGKIYKALNGYILQVEEMNGIYAIEYLPPEYVENYENSTNTIKGEK